MSSLFAQEPNSIIPDWQELFDQFRTEMEKGTDPASEAVQRPVRRRMELINEFTGGNAGIENSLRTMYQQEPTLREQYGPNPDTHAYICKAAEASKKPV